MRRIIFLLFPFLVFSQSKIEINGKTNINKFTCVNDHPIVIKKSTNKSDIKVPHSILLNVKDFRCNNNRMTEEFQEMLDIERHPFITISNDNFKNASPHLYQVTTSVEMNGVENKYNIKLLQNKENWQVIKSLSLDDFRLKPPTVLGGLVKVKDEVEVNIQIQK